MQLAQDRDHLLAAAAVERARGLVGQDHLAAVHQRARDAHALLLAARELARPVVAAVVQAQAREQLPRPRLARRAVGARVHRRHLDVAGGRQVLHEVVALEDEAEVLAPQLGQRVAVERAHVVARDRVAAAAGAVEAAQDVHQRRLARARGADDREHLAVADVEVHVLEHLHPRLARGEAAPDAAQRQQGLPWPLRHGPLPRRSPPLASPSRGSTAEASPVMTWSPSFSPSSTWAWKLLVMPVRTLRVSGVWSALSTRTS